MNAALNALAEFKDYLTKQHKVSSMLETTEDQQNAKKEAKMRLLQEQEGRRTAHEIKRYSTVVAAIPW